MKSVIENKYFCLFFSIFYEYVYKKNRNWIVCAIFRDKITCLIISNKIMKSWISWICYSVKIEDYQIVYIPMYFTLIQYRIKKCSLLLNKIFEIQAFYHKLNLHDPWFLRTNLTICLFCIFFFFFNVPPEIYVECFLFKSYIEWH